MCSLIYKKKTIGQKCLMKQQKLQHFLKSKYSISIQFYLHSTNSHNSDVKVLYTVRYRSYSFQRKYYFQEYFSKKQNKNLKYQGQNLKLRKMSKYECLQGLGVATLCTMA